MGRGATASAEQNTGIGRTNAATNMQNAGSELNTVAPALTAQASQGFDPATMAAMRTGSSQALGGANASAAGQGALTEARTRNAGAANPMMEESARNAMRQGSENEQKIQMANWGAQQAGLQGLQGLYGTNLNASNQALGLSNQAIGEWNQADANTTNAAMGWANLANNIMKTGGGANAPCWVAASFWGWGDVRTHVVREWVLNESPIWFMKLYLKWGERIARTPLRWLFRPIFEFVLRQTNHGR